MDYKSLLSGLQVNKELLTRRQVEELEVEIGFLLPDDYKDFLTVVNGCEGMIGGKNYVSLWSGTDLGRFNKEYQVAEFVNGMLFIGSDGGGEAFAFDRTNSMSIVMVPFVGMERDLAEPVASTFTEFLKVLFEKDIHE